MTTTLNLLVFGQNGQLARALAQLCQAQNITAQFISSKNANLAANPQLARDFITGSLADVVINAAAYTQVDKAESDLENAHNLNSFAPEIMARACKNSGKSFVHISTDYVFNGQSRQPYKTNELIDPQNIYGETKADGEMAITALGGQSSIVRTSWVYDGVGKNFLTTMLRLGRERERLTVVNDQIGRPTYAADLAQACLNIAAHYQSGVDVADIYHVSNSGEAISWADFARAIFKTANIACTVQDIPTSDYPTPAKRPAYSVLDLSGYENQFGTLPTWQDGLCRALNEQDI